MLILITDHVDIDNKIILAMVMTYHGDNAMVIACYGDNIMIMRDHGDSILQNTNYFSCKTV